MGKGIEWTQANFAKNWMQICKGFAGLPFLSQTLWQVGPMPWLMGGNGWFNNSAWGNIGDSFIHKNSGTETESGTSEVEDTGTPDEIREAKEKAAKEKAEIKKLVANYKKMHGLLEEYAKTLSDSTTPSKTEFQELIKQYPKTLSESSSKEALTTKTANLKAVFDKYKTKIQTNSLNAVKEKVAAANNPEYATHVTALSKAIVNPSQTSGILDNNKLNADIDIIELISAYNSTDSTKASHIMKAIGSKYRVANGATKSKYETLVNALHDKLAEKAESIDKEKLSAETSKLLETSITDFVMFDSIQKRFPSDEENCGANYSNAFDNLYRAIRIAQTELADSKLKEQFDFLGNGNPFTNSTLTTEAKKDLQDEGLENALEVSEPKLNPTDKALEGGYTQNKDNECVYEKDGKFYYYDDESNDFKELEGVTEINRDGTVIQNDQTVRLSNAINPTANAGSPKVVVENLNTIASNMANYLKHGRSMRAMFMKILKDEHQFNKDTVITIIDKCNEQGITNIITRIYSSYNCNADNCNRVVKAVMRRAHDLNLDSSSEFKALWNYFGAKGEFLYNDNGIAIQPENNKNAFQLTKNTSDWIKEQNDGKTSRNRAIEYDYKKIDEMLNELIAKIKETEKSTSVG